MKGGEPHEQQQKAQRTCGRGTLGAEGGEHDEESVSCSDSGSEHPDPCTGCHFIKEINMDAAAIKIAIKL